MYTDLSPLAYKHQAEMSVSIYQYMQHYSFVPQLVRIQYFQRKFRRRSSSEDCVNQTCLVGKPRREIMLCAHSRLEAKRVWYHPAF
jgi:hypothetical protein